MTQRAPENVGRWIYDRAREHPDAIAVVDATIGARHTFASLRDQVAALAGALRDAGVGAGDRVAVALPSESLYLAVYFAASQVGAILLPLNTRLATPELEFQLCDAEPALTIGDVAAAGTGRRVSRDELAAWAAGAGETAEPDFTGGGEDPHVLMYTSGTTGRPKGALLPHRKTLYNTRNAQIYFELTRDDVAIVPIPLFHSFGLKILSVPTLFAGATVVLVDHFDARALPEQVATHGGTLLGAVPVMYRRMLEARPDRAAFAGLRFAFCAGAPLDVATIERYAELGLELRQGYGQTETSILTCLRGRDALTRAGSVGRPVAHGEIRIADANGKSVARGEEGEIVVRGPICMLGYWRRPEETRAAQIDGWHRTGDLGTMDADGFVRLVGRAKDMYISGGENVYPAEVERVLEEHPGVREAAVVGVSDAEWGETGHAFVVAPDLDPDLRRRVLEDWVRERLAGYKRPRHFTFVDALPRTASGKVRKHELALREQC